MDKLDYYEIYDESSNNILFIEAHSLEEAIEMSEHIDFSEYKNLSSIRFDGTIEVPYK